MTREVGTKYCVKMLWYASPNWPFEACRCGSGGGVGRGDLRRKEWKGVDLLSLVPMDKTNSWEENSKVRGEILLFTCASERASERATKGRVTGELSISRLELRRKESSIRYPTKTQIMPK